MKRNMERSSGSSDEDKASLKKAKKENSGKLKNKETEIGETVNGSNSIHSSGRNAQVSDFDRNVTSVPIFCPEKTASGSNSMHSSGRNAQVSDFDRNVTSVPIFCPEKTVNGSNSIHRSGRNAQVSDFDRNVTSVPIFCPEKTASGSNSMHSSGRNAQVSDFDRNVTSVPIFFPQKTVNGSNSIHSSGRNAQVSDFDRNVTSVPIFCPEKTANGSNSMHSSGRNAQVSDFDRNVTSVPIFCPEKTVNGSNSMHSSGRNAQVSDCERNVNKDVDGNSDNMCGIELTHELHSGIGISNDTFASNYDTIDRDTCTILVSCLNSLYNLELENNIDSSMRVGLSNYQRHKVREKESSRNHDGISHEIVPSRHSLLDETNNRGTFDNGENAEGSTTTRKRLFSCNQGAFNYLTEDIDHCVKRPCNCLGVQHRSDQNDENGYNGADRREISEIIPSPWLYSRNERNIDSFHNYQNNGLFIERRELNYRTNSTCNFATNINETGREHTSSQSAQEKYEYDAKCLDWRVHEINQHSSEHSLWDETSIVDTIIDYLETVDSGQSIRRRLFCCPQNALNYLLEDIDNEWRSLCSCQNVQFRNGGSNWCGDGGRKDTSENHSHEHDSCPELRPVVSGAQSCETAVRYPSNRTENSDQVSFNFHPYEAYVHGVQNVENVVGGCGEIEIIGTVVEISDCTVETIPICDSRENDNRAREFNFVSESTLSNDAHKARNYNDDTREAREYNDNVEEEILEGREESGDGDYDEAGDYNEGNYDEAGDYNEGDYDEAGDYNEGDYDEAGDYNEGDYDEAGDYDGDYDEGDYDETEDDDEYFSAEDDYLSESEDGGYISAEDAYFRSDSSYSDLNGSKKRVTHCKVEVEEHMLKVKRVRTENAGDQKTVNNKIGCNVNHTNDNDEKDTEQRNGKDKVTEIKLVSNETFTNGKYKKSQNSCNGETKLENILEESVSNCNQETTDEDGSKREETMINNEEYILLAEELTGLFRDIYRDAMARNGEENSISKCKIRSKTLDSVIKISNAKGESYLCNMTNSKKYNSNCACNPAEKSDEALGTEAKNCNSDNEVRNERLDESNNRSFRSDSTNTKSFRDISSEKCDRIVCEDSNSSWNSEMNDEGFKKLSSNTYEEYGVQSGQINRKREGNNKAIEMTDKFADCQRNAKSHEEYSTRGTSDEVSDSSTDVKISDEEGKYSSGDAEYDRRCNELINAEKMKRMKCKVEKDTSSYERDRSELDGESDMSTDEDSWSDVKNSAEENNDLGTEESDNSSEEEIGDDSTDEINNEETDSPGTGESDNSSEEGCDDDNTNQSSDEVSSSYGEENSETSSGENDSTDSESPVTENGMSTDEDSSNESEYDNDSEAIDENPEEDKNTSYEEIDSEMEGTRTLSNGESSKTTDITDDESSNSACEERNGSTDLVTYYRGVRKVNVTSGDAGSSVTSGKAHARLNYRSKEIIDSSTDDENCLDCKKECCSSETVEYLSDSENIKKRTLESVSKVNDESSSEGSKSSDDMSDLESLFGSVLGFASHRRFSFATLGQDSITVSVTRLKLLPFKDYYTESVDGRHKKRIGANRKGNIITPPVRGNFKDEKTEEKRGRYRIQKKVSDKNKAAEVSDAEEQTSDEELQVKDSTSRKSRNKNGNKQIEYDSDHKEDSESDEDYNEEDENSSEGAIEDNGHRHGDEDEEDIGEEDSDEDYEEEADNEYDEGDDDLEEEEGEYEVEEQEECDSEENGGVEYEVEDEEEEENEEDVDENVTALMQNDDSSEQSSGNDEWNTQAKSKTMTKKKAAKEQARGKTNLVKKKKDRGE